MTRGRDDDHYGAPKPSPASQLAGTMFDAPAELAPPPAPAEPSPPGWMERWASLTESERKLQRGRWQARLLPVVTELAVRRGPEGITASEVIAEGITRGVLNGERSFLTLHPRVYAFVGPWLAQLARGGTLRAKTVRLEGGGEIQVKRESTRDASHGNAGLVYVAACGQLTPVHAIVPPVLEHMLEPVLDQPTLTSDGGTSERSERRAS